MPSHAAIARTEPPSWKRGPLKGRREQSGVDAEFTEFVGSCSRKLMRTAFLLTGDQQHAEDLVQDSLARTFRSWRRLTVSDNALAYTRKVMYHLQISWWRRRKVAETLTDQAPERRQPGVDGDLAVTVRDALLKLTPRQRAVIVLRYFEDLTEVEAARILGISKSTVHSRARRALDRLATLVPELEGEL